MKRVAGVLGTLWRAKGILSPLLLAGILGFFALKDCASLPLFLSDLFFTTAVLYIATGLFQFVSNLGMFTSAQFGFSNLRNRLRKKDEGRTSSSEDYATFVQSREKYHHYASFLLIGLIMFFASVAVDLLSK